MFDIQVQFLDVVAMAGQETFVGSAKRSIEFLGSVKRSIGDGWPGEFSRLCQAFYWRV